MKYVEYINNLIKIESLKPKHAVLFGQNINAGSGLSGLTKGLATQEGGRVINSTNSENSLVGFGLGLMMNGAKGVFLMKQMDFLLLAVDQLVNTYNIIRSIQHQPKDGSFTIVAVVVDSGYEGPQSALNNFADFCSIARIPGFAITNKADADYLLPKYLFKPGFRIIGISQRLEKNEIIEPGTVLNIVDDGTVFQYSEGDDVTVVSFNFSFPQVYKLVGELEEKGIHASHFNVNSAIVTDWKIIEDSVKKTKKIVVIDDSKSKHIPADNLISELFIKIPQVEKKIILRRELAEDWLYPVSDVFEVSVKKILEKLMN
jgi:pyruvate/2-oxoglutarate/acetoin dehydrogenase E1 component